MYEYFRIIYQVPEYKRDGEPVYETVDCKFKSGDVYVTTSFREPYKVYISARDWAEDYAYSLSDKGWYEIERINEKQYRPNI